MQALFSILSMFAGPLGQLAMTGVTAGAAAFTTYMVNHGVPADSATVIVGGLVTAITGALQILTGTQSVQIKSVRAAENGVTVVPATPANKAQAVDVPLK